MGARELGLMKPTAILINTCRGPVVDEDALHDALIADRIRGAGLDVMVEEPPAPEHKLFTLPHHPDAPYGGAELGELEEGVPQLVRQHRARRPRREAAVGGAGIG